MATIVSGAQPGRSVLKGLIVGGIAGATAGTMSALVSRDEYLEPSAFGVDVTCKIERLNSDGKYVAIIPGTAVLPNEHLRFSASVNPALTIGAFDFKLDGVTFASPVPNLDGNAYYDINGPATNGPHTFTATIGLAMLIGAHTTGSEVFTVSPNAPVPPVTPPGGGILPTTGFNWKSVEVAGALMLGIAGISAVAGLIRSVR